jgi:hypothetical protein
MLSSRDVHAFAALRLRMADCAVPVGAFGEPAASERLECEVFASGVKAA